MKKPIPSLLCFFALIAFSHPSFAQDAPANPAPKIVRPPALTPPDLSNTHVMTGPAPVLPPSTPPNVVATEDAPPAISTQPIWPTQMPNLPAPKMPNVVVKDDGAPTVSTQPIWPAQMPNLPAPKMPNVVLRHDERVSADDLRDLRIKVKFKGLNAQLTGSLPKFCVDSMRMDVSPQDRTTGDDNDDVDSESTAAKKTHKSNSDHKEIADQEDLDNHTVVYGTSVIFKASDKYNTLQDCVKGEAATDLKSLATSNYLNKSILLDKDYARIGFVDSSGHITLGGKGAKSESYAKLENILSAIANPSDCATCNFDPTVAHEVSKEIDGLSAISPLLRKAAFDVNLNASDLDKNLDDIKNLRGVKNFRDKLRKFASMIPTLGLDEDAKIDAYNTIETYYGKLQDKTGKLALGDPDNANLYSMMIAENAKVMARTPGMTREFKDQQLLAESTYAKGGEWYYRFTAAYNPNSPEVRRYYDKLNGSLQRANGFIATNCTQVDQGRSQNTRMINACAQAHADASRLQPIIGPIAQSLNPNQQMLPPATAQNSFTGAMAPPGSHALAVNPNGSINNGSNSGQLLGANSLYSLDSQMFPNASQYQPIAPNYLPNAESQYQITNPAAVPLNLGSPVPQYNSAVAPQYIRTTGV